MKTKTEIDELIDEYIYDNDEGDITASQVNEILKDLNEVAHNSSGGGSGDSPISPAQFNKGYKVLDSSTPIKEQITEANTIYEIKYGFSLGYEKLTMPENCVLKFNGGSLYDGTLNLKNTAIENIGNSVIFRDVTLEGTPGSDLKASYFPYSDDYTEENFKKLKNLYAVVRGTKYNVDFDIKTLKLYYTGTIVLDAWKKYDFHNATIYAHSDKNYQHLFCVEGHPETTQYNKIASAAQDEYFKYRQGLIVVKDKTPLYKRYIDNGQEYQRTEVLMVQNNELLDNPIMDYDNDPDTDAEISFLPVNPGSFEFCNLRYDRTESEYHAALVYVHYCYKPIIHNITCDSDHLSLSAAECGTIQLYYVYAPHLYDLTMNSSYGNVVGSGEVSYGIRIMFSTRILLERVYTNAKWHSFSCKCINGAVLRDCVTDQWDNHTYSKDFVFENCTFHTDHVQDPEVGYSKFINCKFLHFHVGINEDSDMYTYPIKRIFENCVFEEHESPMLLVSKKHPTEGDRQLIVSNYYPSLSMKNCVINMHKSATSLTIYKVDPENTDLIARDDTMADIYIEDLTINAPGSPVTVKIINVPIKANINIDGIKSVKGTVSITTENCSKGFVSIDKTQIPITVAEGTIADSDCFEDGYISRPSGASSTDSYTKAESDSKYQAKGNYISQLKTINNQSLIGSGNITISSGSGGGSSVDNNLLNALKNSMPLANNLIDANVDLPLLGYVSQATHTFVEDSSGRFRCSGPISVKGAANVTFSANAWCNHTNPDDYDLVQMVFLDKDMNAIPDLDIRVDDITTKSVNLLSEEYKDVYYVILSGDTNGHGIPKTYLKIKGVYNFNNFLTPDNFTYRQGYNLFDVNKIEYKKGITSGGEFIDDSQAIVSNLIELPDDRGRNGDLFLFNLPVTTYSKRFIYYDKDMNVVAGPSDIGAAATQAQINCRADAKYFRISIMRALNPLPSEEAVKEQLKDVMITFYYGMKLYQPHWKYIETIGGSKICASSVAGLYSGKKWAVLGDSLTERNNHSIKFYYDYVKESLGFTIENMGDSGTGYMCRQDVGTAFYQRIENLPEDVDVLTIFGSFNDVSSKQPLGTISDTGTASVCGCINTLLNWIFTNRPGLKFGIIAPCPWKELNPKGDTTDSNSAISYVVALRQICEKNSIPFLDLFHNSGLRPWDRTFRDLFYNRDQQTDGDYHGTHPNEKGHEILATHIKEFVKSLI